VAFAVARAVVDRRLRDPGRGRTKTGRLWSYVRDDRPFADKAAPAVRYCYSPDRKGEHPRTHLGPFRCILQADGYQGYAGLYDRGVTEAACWAHARRKFFDEHAETKSPLALEALQRIREPESAPAAFHLDRTRRRWMVPAAIVDYLSGIAQLSKPSSRLAMASMSEASSRIARAVPSMRCASRRRELASSQASTPGGVELVAITFCASR
jgi:hypothetical protein